MQKSTHQALDKVNKFDIMPLDRKICDLVDRSKQEEVLELLVSDKKRLPSGMGK